MDTRECDPSDPLANSGLVIVDKPQGMTSHDVVSRLRRIFGTRKVGHAGTLDPMATGVLVAGINRGTKFLPYLVGADKTYIATVRFGGQTTTEDAEGELTESTDARLSHDQIEDACAQFRGDIMQRPSSVSAIKIAGKRSYQRVRDGEDVEIPARPIRIHQLTVDSVQVIDSCSATGKAATEVQLTVRCSSGTYIRALARDIGEALGVGGYLIGLRRTAVGPFGLDSSRTLEELGADDAEASLSLSLDAAALQRYPVIQITDSEAVDLSQGKRLAARELPGELCAAQRPDGKVVALVQASDKGVKTEFVIRPSTL